MPAGLSCHPLTFGNPLFNCVSFSTNRHSIKATTGIVIGLGIGAVALFLYRRAQAAGNLKWFPGNIKGVGTADGNPYIDFSVIAGNTANTGLLLNSFDATVIANGTLVGHVSNYMGVEIPGNSQVEIPLRANLLLIGLVNDLLQSYNNGTGAQTVEIDGMANVNSFQVPVKLAYQLG